MAIKFWKNVGPYGCLSNFSKDPITVSGIHYQTSEHYFQSEKFLDEKNKMDVINCSTPHLCAETGRDKTRPLRDDWELVKNHVMYEALRLKVEQNPIVKATLLSTKDEEIIEDSPIDYYWGCGRDGSGVNMLGKLWMKLREDLVNGT